ncbi:Hypothetical protein PHPALM_54 [Phytophthora palmivora]|uniref:Integrase catalytic domain-containing protein n=1 Tax=Phytophthora palmivora TaxID=4796 RepID=A0A2P4YVT3_9STRA|nr:Hypothetical protein PHPALM_54 [Phytophthora palmivora]
MTVAYRAQGDGQTERMNRTLKEYLRCFVSPLQDDWDVHLANAEFAINSAVNSSIKMSPFEADLGYVPHNPLTAVAASSRRRLRGGRQQGTKFTEHQEAVLRQCQEALEDAQAPMADVYDRGRKEQVFKIGDQVYLSTKNLDIAHAGFPNSRKLGPKWIGPYSVVRTYEPNLLSDLKLHPVFNIKPYEKTSRLSRPQDVILHDGKVGKLVEAIIDKRKRKRNSAISHSVGEAKATWELRKISIKLRAPSKHTKQIDPRDQGSIDAQDRNTTVSRTEPDIGSNLATNSPQVDQVNFSVTLWRTLI